MSPTDTTKRILIPRPTSLQIESQRSSIQTLNGPPPTSINAVPPKPRQRKNATWTDQEWEHQKPNFIRLFLEQDLPLQDVIRKIDKDHHFKAT